jgi:hypothetical protein
MVSPAGIPDAIRRSMAVLATHRALFGRRTLARWDMNEQQILKVVATFTRCDAAWGLVGAHAIGLITEPRATADFDFIVEGTKIAAVIAALRTEFGDLDANDIGAAVQLRAIDVDLIRSTNHALFQRALTELRTVGDWRVPRTEVLIALKFLAAVSPWRDRNKRRADIADLGGMFQAAAAELDRALMTELASLVYPGAEREFGELIGKLERGEPITI